MDNITIGLGSSLGELGLLERLSKEAIADGTSSSEDLIRTVKDKTYKRVQGIGDDYIPNTQLYNAVGAIYPMLSREDKNDAIFAHLNQMDGLNWSRVNTNHTPYIRDPQLLSDISIVRSIYWPGLNDEKRLWDGVGSFSELQKDVMEEDGLFKTDKVKSDFLVAYAIMRSDFTSFGDDYVKAVHPKFLDRVLKGIVALRFAGVDPNKADEGRDRLYELLPKSVHDKIEPMRKEEDWADRNNFT